MLESPHPQTPLPQTPLVLHQKQMVQEPRARRHQTKQLLLEHLQ